MALGVEVGVSTDDVNVIRELFMKRWLLALVSMFLVVVVTLVVCYVLEPVGYYYRWGSSVDDMPDDFECDKPFDLGGCDVFFVGLRVAILIELRLCFIRIGC